MSTNIPTAEQVTEYINEKILPLLAKYGATVVETNPSAHLQVEPGMIFYPLEIEFQGEQIALSGGDIERPVNIEFLLKHWDRVQKVLRSLDGTTDPFHSDVRRAFEGEFDRRTLQHDQIAYGYVCDKIRKSGRRLWTE